tara:strand:- start:322 stop:516 length:195 start_codon:yes stop_codon:yes gene_type:complete
MMTMPPARHERKPVKARAQQADLCLFFIPMRIPRENPYCIHACRIMHNEVSIQPVTQRDIFELQ